MCSAQAARFLTSQELHIMDSEAATSLVIITSLTSEDVGRHPADCWYGSAKHIKVVHFTTHFQFLLYTVRRQEEDDNPFYINRKRKSTPSESANSVSGAFGTFGS